MCSTKVLPACLLLPHCCPARTWSASRPNTDTHSRRCSPHSPLHVSSASLHWLDGSVWMMGAGRSSGRRAGSGGPAVLAAVPKGRMPALGWQQLPCALPGSSCCVRWAQLANYGGGAGTAAGGRFRCQTLLFRLCCCGRSSHRASHTVCGFSEGGSQAAANRERNRSGPSPPLVPPCCCQKGLQAALITARRAPCRCEWRGARHASPSRVGAVQSIVQL